MDMPIYTLPAVWEPWPLRLRICAGCQWCDPSIKDDSIERKMDQAKGLAGMRCDRGRLVYRDEPGFLISPGRD